MAFVFRAALEQSDKQDSISSVIDSLNAQLGSVKAELSTKKANLPSVGEVFTRLREIANLAQKVKELEQSITESQNELNTVKKLKELLQDVLAQLVEIGVGIFSESVQRKMAEDFATKLEQPLTERELIGYFAIALNEKYSEFFNLLIEKRIITAMQTEITPREFWDIIIDKVESQEITPEYANKIYTNFNQFDSLKNSWKEFSDGLIGLERLGFFPSIRPSAFITTTVEQSQQTVESEAAKSNGIITPEVYVYFLQHSGFLIDFQNAIGEQNKGEKFKKIRAALIQFRIVTSDTPLNESNTITAVNRMLKNLSSFTDIIEKIRTDRTYNPQNLSNQIKGLLRKILTIMQIPWDTGVSNVLNSEFRKRRAQNSVKEELSNLDYTKKERLKKALTDLASGFTKKQENTDVYRSSLNPSQKSKRDLREETYIDATQADKSNDNANLLKRFLEEVVKSLQDAGVKNPSILANAPFSTYTSLSSLFYSRTAEGKSMHPSTSTLGSFLAKKNANKRGESNRYLFLPELIRENRYLFDYAKYIEHLTSYFEDTIIDESATGFDFFQENPYAIERLSESAENVFTNTDRLTEDQAIAWWLFLGDVLEYKNTEDSLNSLISEFRNKYPQIAQALGENKQKITPEFLEELASLNNIPQEPSEISPEDFEAEPSSDSEQPTEPDNELLEKMPDEVEFVLDNKITQEYVQAFFAQSVNGKSVWETMQQIFNGSSISSYLKSKRLEVNSTPVAEQVDGSFDWSVLQTFLNTYTPTQLRNYTETQEFAGLTDIVKLFIWLAIDKYGQLTNLIPKNEGEEENSSSSINITKDIFSLPKKVHTGFDLDRQSIVNALQAFQESSLDNFTRYYPSIIKALRAYFESHDQPRDLVPKNDTDKGVYTLCNGGHQFRIVFIQNTSRGKTVLICGLIYTKSSGNNTNHDTANYERAKAVAKTYLEASADRDRES